MRFKIFLPIFVAILFFTISGHAQTSTNTPTPVEQAELKTVKIKVTGINCSADCKDIEAAVSKVAGVTACKIKGKPGATTAFEVTFDPAVVAETDIRKAVEGTAGCTDPHSRPYKMKG